jgi:hypothetical protein
MKIIKSSLVHQFLLKISRSHKTYLVNHNVVYQICKHMTLLYITSVQYYVISCRYKRCFMS